MNHNILYVDKEGIQMKKIWIIPPVPKENKKMRVAAYCRVSTFEPA